MLKIREYDDNGNKIDLKVLEKFGFKKYEDGEYSSCHRTENDEYAEIIIEIDRYVSINPFGENDIINNSILDILYDLTKADLVEKVSNNNVH